MRRFAKMKWLLAAAILFVPMLVRAQSSGTTPPPPPVCSSSNAGALYTDTGTTPPTVYTCSYYNLTYQWIVNPSYGGLAYYPTLPSTCSTALPAFLSGWPATQMYLCTNGTPTALAGTGTIINSGQYQIPYYSISGGGQTIKGDSSITTDGSGNLTAKSYKVTGAGIGTLVRADGVSPDPNITTDGSGNLKINSIIVPRVVNVMAYGCKGDGVTDDTACLLAAGNAVQAITTPVQLYFPPGKYVANPLLGMVPFTTGLTTTSFFYFTNDNVKVLGDHATILMKSQATPYNQQVAITSGNSYDSFWFEFTGSNIEVSGMTFDNNAQTAASSTCVFGSYGCFLGHAIKEQGPVGAGTQPNNIFIHGNQFLQLDGWPAIAFNAGNVRIADNYAEQSEGMVCANGTDGCTISDNISINSRDAAYAVNGNSTLSVTNFAITGNVDNANTNGGGIDVTAAGYGTVTGNHIFLTTGNCINLDKTGGPYLSTIAVVLPAHDVDVSGNFCDKSILVGDVFSQYNTGGTPTNFTPGGAAYNVKVVANSITTSDSLGNGIYVGYGSKDISVDSNTIISVSGTCTGCGTAAQRIQIASGTNESDLLEFSGNNSDTAYSNEIELTGTVPTISLSWNPGWEFSGTLPTNDQGRGTLFGRYVVNDLEAGTFFTPFGFYAPNATGSQASRIFVGQAGSNYNSASFGWYGQGTLGATSNDACMGLSGNEELFCVTGVGNSTTVGLATAQHFRSSGTPTVVCGTGAGTSPSVCSIAGNDEAGQISVTTGAAPANAGTIATVTLHDACPTSVYPVIRGSNANAASLSGTTHEYPDNFTATTWTITANATGLAASTAYTWSYIARCN